MCGTCADHYHETGDNLAVAHSPTTVGLLFLKLIGLAKIIKRGMDYRRSGNFRVKKLSYDKFSFKNFFVGTTPYRISVNSAC